MNPILNLLTPETVRQLQRLPMLIEQSKSGLATDMRESLELGIQQHESTFAKLSEVDRQRVVEHLRAHTEQLIANAHDAIDSLMTPPSAT